MKKKILSLSIIATLLIALLTSCSTPLDGAPRSKTDFENVIKFFDGAYTNIPMEGIGGKYKAQTTAKGISLIDLDGNVDSRFEYLITTIDGDPKEEIITSPDGNKHHCIVTQARIQILKSNDVTKINKGSYNLTYTHSSGYDKLEIHSSPMPLILGK